MTKLDGSLAILYFLDSIPQIATRGSFTSEQAVKAQEENAEGFVIRCQEAIWKLLYPEVTRPFKIDADG